MIRESEIEDCQNEIKRQGFDVRDFSFKPEERPIMIDSGVQALKGTVTAYRISSGVEAVYVSGYGSIWPVEFIRDLKSGNFSRSDE